ncbi:MAG: DUF4382 domain-containing protein [Vicinamibacterales bacterium]
MRLARWSTALPLAALVAGLNACSGDSAVPPSPSGSSTQASATGGSGATSTRGALTIRLTDSPFSDAQALLVTFSEVSVHRADPGEWVTLPFMSGTSRTCDLKKLQNGATDLLGVGQLAAGKYTQIRLTVTSADIFFDNATSGSACGASIPAPAGTKASVDIPSGEIKLNNEFTLSTAGTTITLDFDGDQSVRQTGGANSNGNGNGGNGRGNGSAARYMMTPVIRVLSVQ